MIFSNEKIGDHVEKIQKWNPLQNSPNESFRYIDLSSVDKDKKIIDLSQIQRIICRNAPSRARQLVKSSDILISTVRPNLNGIAKVPNQLEAATASTGYCILRPNNETLYSGYLFYWVQSNSFVSNMMEQATGANYPAVSDKIIKKSEIPLPPLQEQKKIAEILDAADALRQKDQQLIDHYTALSQSLFLDMFGDPVNNPNEWIINEFGETLTAIKGGTSVSGNDRQILAGEKAVIKISAVTSGIFNYNEYKVVEDSVLPVELIPPLNDDLLFSRANTREMVGATCIVNGNYEHLFLPDKIWRLELKTNKATNWYIKFLLTHDGFRENLRKIATGTSGSMLNISKSKLNKLKIPLPPIELQNQFAERIKIIEQQKQQVQASLEQSNNLFNSLLQKAFTGELTGGRG